MVGSMCTDWDPLGEAGGVWEHCTWWTTRQNLPTCLLALPGCQGQRDLVEMMMWEGDYQGSLHTESWVKWSVASLG